MRVSVKVAPGVRVSGRVGGRHHHHHHHTTVQLSTPSTSRPGGWMHNPPPWRMPRAHVHGIFGALFYLFLLEIFACVWMYEAMAWLSVWACYGLYRACRGIYKRNVIGQTVAAVAPAPKRPAYDPHGAPARPVDLAQLGDDDPWDRPTMRRRS